MAAAISLSFICLSGLQPCFGAGSRPLTRSVSGIVTDQNGNPVKGAVVLIENTAVLRIRSYITQDDGKYHFAGLYRDVDYRLKAKYNGWAGQAKTLSEFDSHDARVINLKVRGPE
ncbi:MAG: carboxypeptidase-like regulatory domain-containing protein [Bryobacteraceae bacterium]